MALRQSTGGFRHRLIFVYSVAVLALALLVLIGQAMIQRSLNELNSHRVVFTAARDQITVANELLGYSVGLKQITSRDEPTNIILAFRSALSKLETLHETWDDGRHESSLSSEDAAAVGPLISQAEDSYGRMHDVAGGLAQAINLRSTYPRDPNAQIADLASAETAYVDAMRSVYTAYEDLISRDVVRSKRVELFFALTVLMCLVLEIVFLIAPAHRATARYVERSVRADEHEARHRSELARQAAERARRAMEAQFQTLFRDSTMGVALIDDQGLIVECNAALERVLGRAANEIAGTRLDAWFGSQDMAPTAAVNTAAAVSSRSTRELRCVRADGRVAWVEVNVSPVRGPDGATTLWVGMVADVTERKLAEDQLRYDATHDTLTKLFNRRYLEHSMQHLFERAKATGRGFGLAILDLDHFKYINDSGGHSLGDAVLVEVAHRITACARSNDVVARLGGDEFAILLEDAEYLGASQSMIERLRREISAPIWIGGRVVGTNLSVGLSFWSPALQSAGDLLQAADAAVYRAKSNGRACSAVFDNQMAAQNRSRMQLATDLRFALERNQLGLVYQPIFETIEKRCVGFEALVRWSHPEVGVVSPAKFIPIAEESGLIVPIGRWVLHEACRQLAEWRKQFPSLDLKVNVNASAQQLAQPGFANEVAAAVRATGLRASALTVELTETAMIEGERLASDVISRIKALGVGVSLDDFGTGYSSLSYLKRFPVDSLKIDRSFISGEGGNLGSEAIVRMILALAGSLNISVVAEGVETEAQFRSLQTMRCNFVQGFRFSRALDVEKARALLAHTALQAPRHAAAS
jgi:diguanylate cyclase (GGDEF)-like protein/PAS domain S-box-containing protein